MPLFSVDDGMPVVRPAVRRCTGTARRGRWISPRSPSCLSLRPVASVRFPPPLSPATMMRGRVDAEARRVARRPTSGPRRSRSARPGTAPPPATDDGVDAVAEVDHRDGDALGGDDAAPGAVHAVVARHRLPCRRRGCSRRTATRSSSSGRMNCSLIVLPSGSDVTRVLGDVEALRRRDRPRCRTSP